MHRRDLLTRSLAALSTLPMAMRRAAAQSKYPERPIRLVIPFPPGGVYDAVGRPWADRVKSSLGTVVVENIGGAGGSLGAAAVARSPSDGYTLLLGGGGALVLTPIASSRPPFDPVRDFEPIALLITTGLAIVVHPSLPVKTLAELIDYARINPGKLSYGSAGVGSMNQLTGELFKSLSGAADIVHVPYKGAGPAITDLISGQIPIATPNVTAQILELHHAGNRAELHRPVRAGAHAARYHRAGGADHACGDGRRGVPAQPDGVGIRAGARVHARQDPALRRGRGRPLGSGHQGDRSEARLSGVEGQCDDTEELSVSGCSGMAGAGCRRAPPAAPPTSVRAGRGSTVRRARSGS